ncbi:MAG: hypothetical protein AAF629_20470 [Chloroflexota bacterium]
MNPKVRDDLLLTDLGDELVIYDPTNFNGHNLNKTSKLVFEYCDGHHTIQSLGKMLELELKMEDGTDFASLALKQLNKKELLEANSLPETPTVTRREVLKLAKMAGLTIALLPVIQSIVVPAPASAASGLGATTCIVSDVGRVIETEFINGNVAATNINGQTASRNTGITTGSNGAEASAITSMCASTNTIVDCWTRTLSGRPGNVGGSISGFSIPIGTSCSDFCYPGADGVNYQLCDC